MRTYEALDLRKNGGPILVVYRDNHRLYTTVLAPSSLGEARAMAYELNKAFSAGKCTQRGLVMIRTEENKTKWVSKKKFHLDAETVAGYNDWAKKNRRQK
jgi:hypothetical protein